MIRNIGLVITGVTMVLIAVVVCKDNYGKGYDNGYEDGFYYATKVARGEV